MTTTATRPPSTTTPPTTPPPRAKGPDLRPAAISVGIFAAFVLIWQAVFSAGIMTALAPSPLQVWDELVATLSRPFYVEGSNSVGIFWHLVSSLRRVAIGFLAAVVVAVPLGFWLGTSKVVGRAVDPFVQVLRPVSPLAWLPIGLAMLQDSELTALFVIFMSALWPVLLNTISGVRGVPQLYLDLCRTLKANRWTTATKVVLPAALPGIVTGMRISLGIAWLVIIAAEMLIGGRGMGYIVWNSWNNLQIPTIIVAIGVIGVVGIVLDASIRQLERLVPR